MYRYELDTLQPLPQNALQTADQEEGVDYGSMVDLAALLRVTDKGRALTRLELGNNPLGDRGVAVLAQLLHSNAHLRHLGLSATGAQNHAGRELGAMLASNGYLLTLDLSFNITLICREF